jgi:hypothetical protein
MLVSTDTKSARSQSGAAPRASLACETVAKTVTLIQSSGIHASALNVTASGPVIASVTRVAPMLTTQSVTGLVAYGREMVRTIRYVPKHKIAKLSGMKV